MMKKLLLTLGLWLGLTSSILAQAVPVGNILLQQRAQGSGGLSVSDIATYTIAQISSGTFLSLTGGIVNGQFSDGCVTGCTQPVPFPDGASWMGFQAPASRSFGATYFDQNGTRIRTFDQATGRIDAYTNSTSGQTAGPPLVVAYDNATPTNLDILGHFAFRGRDSNLNFNTYAYVIASAETVSAAGLNSALQLGVMKGQTSASGNAQPNAFATLDGSASTFSLPTGFAYSSTSGTPFTASAAGGPNISLTNTTNTRTLTVGVLDNFNGGINTTGGSSQIQAGGIVGVSVSTTAVSINTLANTNSTNIGTGTNTGTLTLGNASNTGKTILAGISTGTNADFLCLSAGGVVLLQSTACTISSARFKKDIVPVSDKSSLADVLKLTPVSFTMKETNRDPNAAHPQIGLLAENVAEVDPNLAVFEDDMKTPKSYRQESVIARLVGAIHELSAANDNLRACNDNWKCRLFGIR